MKIEIKPTEDIHKWYRFYSFRFAAIGALLMGFLAAWPDALNGFWAAMPDDVKVLLPHNITPIISAILFLMSALSRLVKQNVHNNDKAEEEKPG